MTLNIIIKTPEDKELLCEWIKHLHLGTFIQSNFQYIALWYTFVSEYVKLYMKY